MHSVHTAWEKERKKEIDEERKDEAWIEGLYKVRNWSAIGSYSVGNETPEGTQMEEIQRKERLRESSGEWVNEWTDNVLATARKMENKERRRKDVERMWDEDELIRGQTERTDIKDDRSRKGHSSIQRRTLYMYTCTDVNTYICWWEWGKSWICNAY